VDVLVTLIYDSSDFGKFGYIPKTHHEILYKMPCSCLRQFKLILVLTDWLSIFFVVQQLKEDGLRNNF